MKNEITAVTMAMARADETPELRLWWRNTEASFPASVAAPNVPDSRVATVTPICTADRNRLGSWASRAARWPRLPRFISERTWPSRSETRAISAAAKNPPIENYDQDDGDVPADVVHVVIPDLGKSAWPRGVRSV